MAAVRRSPAVWRTLVAAAVVAGVWLVPLGLAYHRYGGFVSITHITAVNPTPLQTVVALGVLLPLGLAGTAALAARPDGAARAEVVVLWAVPGAACAAGAILGHGGEVLGTPALLRWSRYLPFLALGLAVPAGIAAERAVAWARRWGAPAGAAAAAALVALAVPSTVLATLAVERQPFPDRLACTRLPGPHDLTAVGMRQPLADEVAMDVFAQTGRTGRLPAHRALEGALPHLAASPAHPAAAQGLVARPAAARGGAARRSLDRGGPVGRAAARLAAHAGRRVPPARPHLPRLPASLSGPQQGGVVTVTSAGAETPPFVSALSTVKVCVVEQARCPTVWAVVVSPDASRRPFESTS